MQVCLSSYGRDYEVVVFGEVNRGPNFERVFRIQVVLRASRFKI